MHKKILIAVGGSGGHVYPAISLAQAIHDKNATVEIVFAGGGLATNKFIDRHTYKTIDIPCGQVLTHNPWRMALGALELCRGILKSRALLHHYNPDLVVGFGSYHSFPILSAAKLSGYPYILHAADSIPGKVVRLFSKGALMTGIHFPVASSLLKGHAVKVGIPLRQGFSKGAISRSQACRYYGLDEQRPVVLVFGGSQGARKLNNLLVDALDKLKPTSELQFLHLVGKDALVDEIQRVYDSKGITAHVKAFESRMDIAWSAATVALVRAGAGTIAELIEYEVPSLLIPYPHAADRHQELNAQYVVNTVKGAKMHAENELDGTKLAHSLNDLLRNETLQDLRAALGAHKKITENREFSSLVLGFLS